MSLIPTSRARRSAAATLCAVLAALVLLAGAGAARGQSLLSSPLSQFRPEPEEDGAADPLGDISPGFAALLTSQAGGTDYPLHSYRRVGELWHMVEGGRGARAYETLKARFGFELRQAERQGRDAEGLRQLYLLYMMRGAAQAERPAEQEALARTFTRDYPDHERYPEAFFELTLARLAQGKDAPESFFFDDAALRSLAPRQQSRYLRARAEHARSRGRYAEAAGLLLQDLEWRSTANLTRRHELEEVLRQMDSARAVEAFIDEHPQVFWLRVRQPFIVAQVQIEQQRFAEALLTLAAIERRGLAFTAAEQQQVADLRAEVRRRTEMRPERIGVLLPLGSSSYTLRELSRETLEGLRLAVQFPKRSQEQQGRRQIEAALLQDLVPDRVRLGERAPQRQRPFELVVRDTANSPDQAARQVDALVRDEHVAAIIGPLARAESAAAAERAEALGVPLVSFSVSLDLAPKQRYIFRHSKSPEDEVRDLVRYAMDYLHARRFAVLYPDTSYGQRMKTLFWERVAERGGEVRAAAAFTPTRTRQQGGVGFKEIFRQFTGLDRPIPAEFRELLERVDESEPDPLVDFDALYIPVGPSGAQDLQVIAPYPVTVDAEHVQLLGSSFWNDNAVLVASDGKLDGAVFVDAYDRSSTNPRVSEFRARHRRFFGHRPGYRPPSYYAALGYDTARILMEALGSTPPPTREQLSARLRREQGYAGVTGWTRFAESGEALKESMFFRLRGYDMVRLEP